MMVQVTNLNPFGAVVQAAATGQDIRDVIIADIRAIFEREHLVVLRGFKTFDDKNAFSDYCSAWGEISVWPFGKVLELIEQDHPDDHIFDHNYVPMHWDGMYRPQVPEMQIFHCVNAPGKGNGGRTTFCNTALAWQQATQETRALWARVTGVYERKMEFYHSQTVAPVVTSHPVRSYPVLRYCEPPSRGDKTFVNRPLFDYQGVTGRERATFEQSMQEALYAPANFYAHAWQTGDVVLTDNYTLLHGREAFTSGCARHLQRVHVLGAPALANPHLVFHR